MASMTRILGSSRSAIVHRRRVGDQAMTVAVVDSSPNATVFEMKVEATAAAQHSKRKAERGSRRHGQSRQA